MSVPRDPVWPFTRVRRCSLRAIESTCCRVPTEGPPVAGTFAGGAHGLWCDTVVGRRAHGDRVRGGRDGESSRAAPTATPQLSFRAWRRRATCVLRFRPIEAFRRRICVTCAALRQVGWMLQFAYESLANCPGVRYAEAVITHGWTRPYLATTLAGGEVPCDRCAPA
jgi:hypothetical protein